MFHEFVFLESLKTMSDFHLLILITVPIEMIPVTTCVITVL